jgi:DNA-binding CsgD family transcriptional regulator
MAGMQSLTGSRTQARRNNTVTIWLNTPFQMQFRVIDGLTVRFAQSEDRRAAVTAAEELARGSLEAPKRYLALAEHELTLVPPARGGPALALLGAVRLLAWFEAGSAWVGWRSWLVQAFLLEAIVQGALGHSAADPARATLITHILGLPRDAHRNAGLPPVRSAGAAPSEPRLRESLSQAELRVLRYLPTSLSVAEIAGQLYLSVNTVRTHMRHLYDKLDVYRRHEAVERARALGLLAPAVHEEVTRRILDDRKTLSVGPVAT